MEHVGPSQPLSHWQPRTLSHVPRLRHSHVLAQFSPYVFAGQAEDTQTNARARTHTQRQIHTYTRTHARTHARTHTHTRTHAHTDTRIQTHIHTNTHTHKHTHTHTQTHTHTHTHTRTHTYTCSYFKLTMHTHVTCNQPLNAWCKASMSQ